MVARALPLLFLWPFAANAEVTLSGNGRPGWVLTNAGFDSSGTIRFYGALEHAVPRLPKLSFGVLGQNVVGEARLGQVSDSVQNGPLPFDLGVRIKDGP